MWLCHRCDWKGYAGSAPITHLADFRKPDKPTVNEKTKSKMRNAWREGFRLDALLAKPARNYLIERGLEEIIQNNDYPADIRFHPRLKYWSQDDKGKPCLLGSYPALLSAIRDRYGDGKALFRTYLQTDGKGKAPVPTPKKAWTYRKGSIKGNAIRLYPAGRKLAIAEGQETALAIRLATGLPVWCAMFADNLKQIDIPLSVRELLICGDTDESGKGQECAHALARRLSGRLQAKVVLPPKPGEDWLDIFSRGQHKAKHYA